jgi:peptidoglycan/xylan/chitin deacetylase (PgdA/CDA1 family)
MSVSIDNFEKQVRFLKRNFRLLSAEELMDFNVPDGYKNKGQKACLITFDDGYEDNYSNALPILRKYSCPAIFFISSGLIGNDQQFAHDKTLQPCLQFRKMSWDQLQDAHRTNIAIGIHSNSHANLSKITFEEAVTEIESSIIKYQEHMGNKPTLMSYPFGGKHDITPEIIDYIKRHYSITMLFSAYGNKNISPFDNYNIKRINIGAKDNGIIFWIKAEGGLKTLFNMHDN